MFFFFCPSFVFWGESREMCLCLQLVVSLLLWLLTRSSPPGIMLIFTWAQSSCTFWETSWDTVLKVDTQFFFLHKVTNWGTKKAGNGFHVILD